MQAREQSATTESFILRKQQHDAFGVKRGPLVDQEWERSDPASVLDPPPESPCSERDCYQRAPERETGGDGNRVMKWRESDGCPRADGVAV